MASTARDATGERGDSEDDGAVRRARAVLRSALTLHRGRWVVTIGVFDGVHAGHRALVGAAADIARARECGTLAITFSPRPDQVLGAADALPDLCSMDERVRRLRRAGADAVAVIPFTRALARIEAGDYLAHLEDALDLEAVCVGEDFRFGRDRRGSVAFLRNRGVEVVTPPLVTAADRRKVSSSRLRELRRSAGTGHAW